METLLTLVKYKKIQEKNIWHEKRYNLVPVKNLGKRKKHLSELYILIKESSFSLNKLIFVAANQQ